MFEKRDDDDEQRVSESVYKFRKRGRVQAQVMFQCALQFNGSMHARIGEDHIHGNKHAKR